MLHPKKMTERFSALETGLIILCFCVCMAGALLLPVNQCPDEGGRLILSNWIADRGTLPTGDEPEVIISGWGFSYALRPYLASIVGAGFQKLAACFTDSPRILLAASRMCSVLSVTFACVFCLRLGHLLFSKKSCALLFSACVCFLPQVMFLGMYQNYDALSLCAVCAILYYWAEGCERKWPVRTCVGLAVSFSVGLLSYYAVYGWILMGAVFCVLAVMTDPEIPDRGWLILKRAALILGICLLLAGWFFIRNAYLHDGDFFGLAAEEASRDRMREQGYVLHDNLCYRDEGLTILQFIKLDRFAWLRTTVWSFFGLFGYMTIYLPWAMYIVYYAVIAGGMILFLAVLHKTAPCRRDILLMAMMAIASVITFFLHLWQSYAGDYQAQGRYVITLIIPLAFMLAYGADHTSMMIRDPKPGKAMELNRAAVLTALWLLLFAVAALGTMTRMLPN